MISHAENMRLKIDELYSLHGGLPLSFLRWPYRPPTAHSFQRRQPAPPLRQADTSAAISGQAVFSLMPFRHYWPIFSPHAFDAFIFELRQLEPLFRQTADIDMLRCHLFDFQRFIYLRRRLLRFYISQQRQHSRHHFISSFILYRLQ